jgi:two-component system alkaline phosphatase synthesis response regulator PhoP
MPDPADLQRNVHPKILIVEDQKDLLKGLEINLVREGYSVLKASTGEEGVTLAVNEHPHLVLLDVMLPGLSGIDVCRELRRRGIDVPIIFLTAKSDVIDRVVGLESGADDYVIKPFSLPELLARIRTRLRRHGTGPSATTRYSVGEIELDFERLTAARGGRPLHLTPKEFEVLRMLILHRGQAVSRTRMLNEIWGYDDASTTRTVDTHILTLRHKIEDDPGNPRHILTCYGEGYKFVD